MSRKRGRKEAGAFCAIVLLAGTLRFYRVVDLPPGLHFDGRETRKKE
jgi:hypothetical protein